MKKLLLALVFMFPLSVFAGADTDRICADDTKYGLIQGETSFQVSYP
jgi:hypothetical protein